MTDYAERTAQLQQERLALRRKRKREDRLAALLAGLVIAAGLLGIIALYIGLSSLTVYLGWNFGAVGISHALHGHIHSISFLTAIGAGLLIGVLGRIFHRGGVSYHKREA